MPIPGPRQRKSMGGMQYARAAGHTGKWIFRNSPDDPWEPDNPSQEISWWRAERYREGNFPTGEQEVIYTGELDTNKVPIASHYFYPIVKRNHSDNDNIEEFYPRVDITIAESEHNTTFGFPELTDDQRHQLSLRYCNPTTLVPDPVSLSGLMDKQPWWKSRHDWGVPVGRGGIKPFQNTRYFSQDLNYIIPEEYRYPELVDPHSMDELSYYDGNRYEWDNKTVNAFGFSVVEEEMTSIGIIRYIVPDEYSSNFAGINVSQPRPEDSNFTDQFPEFAIDFGLPGQ